MVLTQSGVHLVKRKSLITLIAAAVIIALIIVRPDFLAKYPRIPLHDGSEVRVLQVRYVPGPSHSAVEHNLYVSRARLWLYQRLPSSLRRKIPEPSRGIGYQGTSRPALSVWWAHFDSNHQPGLGEAGDVLMTVDSGEQTNLGWPDAAEDYRQIFITDPPTDSKRLTFEFPVWGERVRFTIRNPAYHR